MWLLAQEDIIKFYSPTSVHIHLSYLFYRKKIFEVV